MFYAFSRDRAVPGLAAVEPVDQRRCPFAAVMASRGRGDHHPAGARGRQERLPVAFIAVVSITVIGLYIAYVIPVYLRWRTGDAFEPGPVDARQEVQVDEPDRRSSGSHLMVIFFCLPSPRRRAVGRRLRLEGVQLRAADGRRRGPRGRRLVAGQRAATSSRARCAHRVRRAAPARRGRAGRAEGRRRPPRRRRDARRHRAGHRGGARRAPARAASRRPTPPSRGRRRRSRPGARSPPATARGCCTRSPTRSRTRREELAMLEARNAGKPIGDARGEMGMVADTFRYYAGAPERTARRHDPGRRRRGDDVPRAARRRRR